MGINTLKLNASSDNLELSVAFSEPECQSPKGIIQLVHGMCEHKERYYPFMEFMASNGYVTVIHDHRGHGKSVKCREDLGFLYEGGWRALVDDIKVITSWTRAGYPGLKLVLLGHSMGSMAVRSFAKRYDDLIDGLIVCGSASRNPAAPAGKLLAGVISLFRGEHFRPRILQKMSFDAYNAPFADEGFSSAWVCGDRQVLEAYHKDPLCQYVFTANGFSNLMGLMMDCYSEKCWCMRNPDMPVNFISGELDPCRGTDAQHAFSIELMKKLGYRKVESHIYPGMRHEILNETEKLVVWNDILSIL